MTKRSKQQRPTCTLLCEGLRKVSKLHASAGEKLACRTEGFSTADLELDNFQASFTSLLRVCTLSWFCSDHLHTRWTSWFIFLRFTHVYFRGSRSVRKNRENLYPTKISRYTVHKQRSHDRHTENPAVHGLT